MADGGGWSTIESDEGVFTSLIENLGVKDVQFEELISLDADTIRSLSPVYGVIFLFKWIRETPSPTPSQPLDGTYATNPPENLFFAAQTIQNACGTQAILSVILNQDSPATSTHPIAIGPELRAFKDFTTGFPPDLRGEALSNSEAIRTAHNAFARASPFVDETVRGPHDEDGDVYHFIAYTPVGGVLYELDGLRPYPIAHGPCDADSFPDKLIGVLQRRIARYPEGETRFNLMAVVRDLRVRARETGDAELLEREARKRRAWAWENTLRRSNFVGFIGEMVKGVVGLKEREGPGAYEKWVEQAKGETQKRLMTRRG
ncbi:putative 26S proteasome-associated ubiquitin C-terminal hydrolase [Aspergillus clavatus NRRL 1]|uniref:Ubiquitin carboxyl-terminal hydrolase n=1 Tax=Aspergillus clavatus (strain ATCC 1007 / CBS 513.65 / DSM 816 / NCTC 3887 / NRRL 1 / QM 1276 / 107) TaxID=344612 RepID=A1CNL6_ASPCL|nr:26S proteasome-associated ubiquitin C-terminal hydrolase, putative [Aspergillus clavatus NRRL 1]EAW07237.1 26S proteasome-associated ubiquitin C-terminal hydrolase, putative [Aspergillus clavatus NRRL 1]